VFVDEWFVELIVCLGCWIVKLMVVVVFDFVCVGELVLDDVVDCVFVMLLLLVLFMVVVVNVMGVLLYINFGCVVLLVVVVVLFVILGLIVVVVVFGVICGIVCEVVDIFGC